MFVSESEEKKCVAKFKDLTRIATNGKPVWTGKVNVGKENMFNDPKRWKEPSVIFVNSMSDLFYEGVSEELVFKMLDKMMEYNWHKYLILTKRAALKIPYDDILYIPLLLFPFIVLLIINDEVI